jgi:uncharacterized protein (DUF169 family)
LIVMNKASARQIQGLLELRSAPVAIAFQTAPPSGIPRVDVAGPSSCTYWKKAAAGQIFYTAAPDHYYCPIGAHTHGLDLPPTQVQELHGVLGTMFSLGYLRQEEVPGIPRRQEPFGVAVYAPLAEAPFEPDIILVCGTPRQVMLLSEAAQAAGAGAESGLMGRPTCAAIPEALRSGRAVASLGCIGNRVYTELADEELYFALPGKHLAAVIDKLGTIIVANRELESYHRAKRASLTAS